MFGLPVKGISYPTLMELYEKRPPQNDLVVLIDRRMWKVTNMTLQQMFLQEVQAMSLISNFWDVENAEVTNYWYMPLGTGSVTYPEWKEPK